LFVSDCISFITLTLPLPPPPRHIRSSQYQNPSRAAMMRLHELRASGEIVDANAHHYVSQRHLLSG
jgi:hypothetical protein